MPLGLPEVIFIFVLALLIFGPKKLPELGRSFGKSMAEFRRASNDLKSTFQREMDSIDEESKQVKEVAQEFKKDLNTNYYDDSEDDYYSDYGETSSEQDASAGKPSTQPSIETSNDEPSTKSSEAVGPDTGSAESQNGQTKPAAGDDQGPAQAAATADAPEVKPS